MKVEYIEHMGDDLSVVNAARVSFDKESEWEQRLSRPVLSERDTKLIQFLARGMTASDFDEFVKDVAFQGQHYPWHGYEPTRLIELLWDWRRNPTHWAPFAHPHATFRIKAPIFVARQLAKHQIGMTWSEVSRRYVDEEPEFYTPEVWRKRAENVKQGSSDEAVKFDGYDVFMDTWMDMYSEMLARGICPEQARMVLPQSTMTEWIWTGSLYAWANVFNQRKPGGHAQRETQEIARQLASHMEPLFPVSWKALTQC
jgi:thymidylate synthase (FAD)